ncbi:MAG TPA: flavodoxin domain-containing protein [Arachnia sp.]|nr:flavodoxin domain-containing protein [Arachnia sp.]HMT85135.1 flavodoxin domain-containing protein [Arachnia sp.]
MARVLVAYATDSGTARDVAAMIADERRHGGDDVDIADLAAEQPSPAGYDLVVVGSGIHAGYWYTPALDWLTARRDELAQTRVALFNTCLNAARDDMMKTSLAYNDAPSAIVAPVASASFAGRFVPAQVGFFKRVFLRTLQQKPKDHVDPVKIRAWAAGLPV